jgi:hypothetical protein
MKRRWAGHEEGERRREKGNHKASRVEWGRARRANARLIGFSMYANIRA